jgi:hypothetical protein
LVIWVAGVIESCLRDEEVGDRRCAVLQGVPIPSRDHQHCVWLYYRFLLSFREVEEMILECGIVVSHETVRQWCVTFGQI